MKIFNRNLVAISEINDKQALLTEMVKVLATHGVISDDINFLAKIWDRENSMSTGIGLSLAVPHAKVDDAKKVSSLVYLMKKPLEYESIDDEPVKFVIMTAVPTEIGNAYHKVLAAISMWFVDDDNRNKLENAGNEDEIYSLLKEIENEI